jgi:cytochrome P450 PksS
VNHPITVGGPRFDADPQRHYSWLRRHAPVYRGRISYLPGQEAFLVSRYHDCVRVVTDPRIRRVVADAPDLLGSDALRFLTTGSMIHQDDPAHQRLHRLVGSAFTPRAVARLGDRVQARTGDMLDTTWPGQRIDLQRSYARPIAVTVINDMVGVPEGDRARFAVVVEPLLRGLGDGEPVAAARRLDRLVGSCAASSNGAGQCPARTC